MACCHEVRNKERENSDRGKSSIEISKPFFVKVRMLCIMKCWPTIKGLIKFTVDIGYVSTDSSVDQM